MAHRPNDNDWYSAEPDVVNSEAWLEKFNNAKGIYDPCPLGWRVPLSTYTPYTLFNDFPQKAGVAGATNFSAEFFGYFPLSGQVINSGNYSTRLGIDTSRLGFNWFADLSSDFLSPYAWINAGTNKIHWVLQTRANAMPIRCVKN